MDYWNITVAFITMITVLITPSKQPWHEINLEQQHIKYEDSQLHIAFLN